MIGVNMSFQDEADREAISRRGCENHLGVVGPGPARFCIVIQDGIDYRCGPAYRIGHQIGDREGGFVEESADRNGHMSVISTLEWCETP